MPFVLADIVDAADVRVVERRDGPGLAFEPGAQVGSAASSGGRT